MNTINFMSLVPLPDFHGLASAATDVRAFEHFSDLISGIKQTASRRADERIDIMDDCLDLVVSRPDLPAGFEFTGFSIAEFRVMLKEAGQSPLLCESFDNFMNIFVKMTGKDWGNPVSEAHG
jgi:hypothetical protein